MDWGVWAFSFKVRTTLLLFEPSTMKKEAWFLVAFSLVSQYRPCSCIYQRTNKDGSFEWGKNRQKFSNRFRLCCKLHSHLNLITSRFLWNRKCLWNTCRVAGKPPSPLLLTTIPHPESRTHLASRPWERTYTSPGETKLTAIQMSIMISVHQTVKLDSYSKNQLQIGSATRS